MQVLQPPSTTSYSNSEGHFIKTFLISTKANEAGWKISKDTIAQKINSFIGKPFVIIPESINDQNARHNYCVKCGWNRCVLTDEETRD